NHREEEDQEEHNSPEIETLTYHVIATYSRVHSRLSPQPSRSSRRSSHSSRDTAEDHIMRHGFDLGYKTWVHHGEPAPPPPPPVIDNTRQPQMSDMTALLNDLRCIPSNNEHNEPTQRDIGETSNKPTQATHNEFEELYASANEKLYPGYDYVTRLDFMTKFTYFKKSSHTAKEMIWHATGKCTEPGKMQHPVDGRAWKNFDTKYPDFAKEPINVRIGLAADGFNPFSNLIRAYSMWPMILTTYNLPPWLCVETIDVASGQKFNMRAMVLWTIIDFPARSSLSGWSGKGYKACPACYVRNKAKPEGSIAEGYVAEEALTFSSHHFWDVTTKFNRPSCNVDPPPPTCQFQVFRSVDNDKDPDVSTTSELFALACGPKWTPISINSCVVDGVRYVVHSRDERRITQNNGICFPDPDGEIYYGQLQEILEFKYLLFKVVLFRVKWFDTRNQGRKVKHLVLRNNMT
nr:hypothetical protein [Tanacetum cinerariifolium]